MTGFQVPSSNLWKGSQHLLLLLTIISRGRADWSLDERSEHDDMADEEPVARQMQAKADGGGRAPTGRGPTMGADQRRLQLRFGSPFEVDRIYR